MKFYHCTYQENVKDIRTRGLEALPKFKGMVTNESAVFLWDDFKVACQYARETWLGKKSAVFEIELDRSDVLMFGRRYPAHHENAWVYMNDIPPERLRLVKC